MQPHPVPQTGGEGSRRSYTLSTGTLSLRIDQDYRKPLFEIAERRNPKRAFLFVSTILGRHIPVVPSDHRAALSALADRIQPHLGAGLVFVMSYAETAIGLGLGVFDELCHRCPDRGLGYLPTTRLAPKGLMPWFETREDHSHAVDHMIFRPDDGVLPDGKDVSIILVDDETTTGNTFAGLATGLARGLQSVGIRPDRLILATLTDWSGHKSPEAVRSLFPAAQVMAISLLAGEYRWTPASGAAPRALPPGCKADCPPWHPEQGADFGVPRTGLSAEGHRSARGAWRTLVGEQVLPLLQPGDRVLVLGSGEHCWHPFLACEQIEEAGFTTRFVITTRSPVALGSVVQHQISFPDHYGIGLTMYLNNVDPTDWDQILLFTETGFDGIPAALRTALGKGWIVSSRDGVARIGEGPLA